MSKDEQDIAAMQAMMGDSEVRGEDLVSGVEQLLQVIDGEFEATDSEGEPPWVIVPAVDSSWWKVVSREPAVREAIRARFRLVEEHEFDAA